MNDSVVSTRKLSKTFGATKALTDVDFDVAPGEVHGLLGENGSGKSTLIKILAGYHTPDEGSEVYAYGQPMSLPVDPKALLANRWSFVHQNLALIEDLRVVDNLNLKAFSNSRSTGINWRKEAKAAAAILARYELAIDPLARVGDLSATEKAMLAIVRAVSSIEQVATRDATESSTAHSGLIVLDEPTVFLPQKERDLLFRLVRSLADSGLGVLIVSHHLDEIRSITDRFTVLRNGEVAGGGAHVTADCTDDEMIELILGRAFIPETRGRSSPEKTGEGYSAIQVSELSSERLHSISFDVRPGEILGITGLSGSGYEDVPYALYGAKGTTNSGKMRLPGADWVNLRGLRPSDALALGIVLVPGDRARQGALGDQSLAFNMSLPHLKDYFRRGRVDRRRELYDAKADIERFDVRPRDPKAEIQNLSGGNQQKVLLAKWLRGTPALMLLDEPTQGIDIGSRHDINVRLRASGIPILCASNDYDQLVAICDRVLVISEGSVFAELQGDQISQDELASLVLSSRASTNIWEGER